MTETETDTLADTRVSDLMPETPDLNAERLAKLKELFPDLFTDEGGLNESELKKLVDPSSVNETERYEFRWFGKSDAKRKAFTPTRATLTYDERRSVNPEASENVIIEGENLKVLKLLLRSYREQIKCIYIDPPYNTGKDFVYSDNYTEDRVPYWKQTGVMDDHGVKMDTNADTDGRFHSNWMNMMFSRLLVARQLLKPDGVIFISIDDNEVHNLRRLCNEVFGAENFIGTIVWKGATDNNPTRIAIEHEYIFCYAKQFDSVSGVWKNKVAGAKVTMLAEYERLFKQHKKQKALIQADFRRFVRANAKALTPLTHYDRVDEDGVYTGSRKVHNPKPGGYKYDVIHPVTKRVCIPPVNGYRHPKDSMNELIDKGKILFGEDETQIIQIKEYLEDYEEKLSSVINLDSRTGSNELTALFGGSKIFTNPKPVLLLKEVFSYCLDSTDMVLDFFGGSGATGQAVMELNEEDGGDRKFILVQLPELTDANSEAYKAGYHRISDITIERNRRVVDRIVEEKRAKHPNLFDEGGHARVGERVEGDGNANVSERAGGDGGNANVSERAGGDGENTLPDGRVSAGASAEASAGAEAGAETGPSARGSAGAGALKGLGFKVFRLEKSYFPRTEWSPDPAASETENVASLKQYIAEKESQLHIDFDRSKLLTEISLKEGFKLNYTALPYVAISTNNVLHVSDGDKEALVCLDDSIAPETVEHFKQAKDMKFVCLERALDTTKKWNLANALGEKFKAF